MCKTAGKAITKALTKHGKVPGQKTVNERLDARVHQLKRRRANIKNINQKLKLRLHSNLQ